MPETIPTVWKPQERAAAIAVAKATIKAFEKGKDVFQAYYSDERSLSKACEQYRKQMLKLIDKFEKFHIKRIYIGKKLKSFWDLEREYFFSKRPKSYITAWIGDFNGDFTEQNRKFTTYKIKFDSTYGQIVRNINMDLIPQKDRKKLEKLLSVVSTVPPTTNLVDYKKYFAETIPVCEEAIESLETSCKNYISTTVIKALKNYISKLKTAADKCTRAVDEFELMYRKNVEQIIIFKCKKLIGLAQGTESYNEEGGILTLYSKNDPGKEPTIIDPHPAPELKFPDDDDDFENRPDDDSVKEEEEREKKFRYKIQRRHDRIQGRHLR